ncbi:MAG TPA: GrpB family protein [Longimicrobium sp.]|jgi:GrpB-like predicted nucleotidyltransferase (UPF0157 family)|nr:GrpB family protein [Longimicrobium sp.]
MRSVPVLGLDRTRVAVVPYDPAWPALFEEEAARLRAALGGHIVSIEHVGSTSIPGLDAKPILDLIAAVASLEEAEGLVPLLRGVGYERKPDTDNPDRLYFVRGPAELRTHHLSLAEPASAFWRQQVRFRDLLRADAALAAEYARLKHALAGRHRGDRLAYAAGKKPFIEAVLARDAASPSRG